MAQGAANTTEVPRDFRGEVQTVWYGGQDLLASDLPTYLPPMPSWLSSSQTVSLHTFLIFLSLHFLFLLLGMSFSSTFAWLSSTYPWMPSLLLALSDHPWKLSIYSLVPLCLLDFDYGVYHVAAVICLHDASPSMSWAPQCSTVQGTQKILIDT